VAGTSQKVTPYWVCFWQWRLLSELLSS
jgi:hypothetical protein